MAITLQKRGPTPTRLGRSGFSLLIAVIFMSVMLTFGVTLGSIAFKQVQLASTSTQSQYAFYAADAGLECALYWDQQKSPPVFKYEAPASPLQIPPDMTCNNQSQVSKTDIAHDGEVWAYTERLSVGVNRCADVSIYKYSSPKQFFRNGVPILVSTYIFSQGYDVACSALGTGVRVTARGQNIWY